jgi:hypothetical protein
VGRRAVAAGLRSRRLILAAALLVLASAHAGHDDIKVDPALKRNPGKVTALGSVYSFEARPLRAPAWVPNELRGWRLTVLAGERFGAAFEVESNTESRITVAPANGPLHGLAVGDLFIVEEIALQKAQ